MLLDPSGRERKEFWAFFSRQSRFAEKTSYIQEHSDHEIEGPKIFTRNDDATIAISLVATFYLHSHRLYILPWVGMNANQIVSFVVRRSLIRENITPHQVSLNQKLRA